MEASLTGFVGGWGFWGVSGFRSACRVGVTY